MFYHHSIIPPLTDSRISELLQAAIASFDEETAPFTLPRVLPIVICVDAGEQSREIGGEIARLVRAALAKFDYRETYEWGPFQGSHLTTIFGTGSQLEDGRTFRERTEALTKEVLERLEELPWKEWGKRTAEGVKLALEIGGFVLIVVPHAGVMVQVTLHISPKVWMVLQAVGKTAAIVESAKKLFFENEQLRQTLKLSPAEPDVSLSRDIQVGRPFKFDPTKVGKSRRELGGA